MAGGIFSGNINSQATALMMIGMLAFACAWEGFTNWLSSKVRAGRSLPAPPPATRFLPCPYAIERIFGHPCSVRRTRLTRRC